jgi:hypothetical protein
MEDLKESNPIEVSEYAAAKSLLETTDFVMWAQYYCRCNQTLPQADSQVWN